MRNGSENNFVYKIRMELGLTEKELSDKMGCSRSTLCSLQSGKTHILSAAARKFVKATGCHEAELVMGIKIPRNSDGTLMQEPDYEQMLKATIDSYEKTITEKNNAIESLTATLNEKLQMIKALSKTISNQEREIKRMEKSLERYESD